MRDAPAPLIFAIREKASSSSVNSMRWLLRWGYGAGLRNDRPSETDTTLRKRTGQIGDGNGNFLRREAMQDLRELADFVETSPGT